MLREGVARKRGPVWGVREHKVGSRISAKKFPNPAFGFELQKPRQARFPSSPFRYAPARRFNRGRGCK